MTWSLFAVHIADSILSPMWWGGGLLVAAILIAWAAFRLAPEMIPRIGLLTAAFFVASSIHVRVGPTSVHLLLNAVVGIMLGHRAALAIFQGLILQYVLLSHGGITSVGVNVCILTIPGMIGGLLFPLLIRWKFLQSRFARWVMVSVSAFVFLVLASASVELLIAQQRGELKLFALEWDQMATLRPIWLSVWGVVALVFGWLEREWENSPTFPLGLLIGVMVASLTVVANFVVLLLGGEDDWRTLAVLVLMAHLPIIALEGIITGFTVSFLMKVKPELLRV